MCVEFIARMPTRQRHPRKPGPLQAGRNKRLLHHASARIQDDLFEDVGEALLVLGRVP